MNYALNARLTASVHVIERVYPLKAGHCTYHVFISGIVDFYSLQLIAISICLYRAETR